jgi:hypothetical protein
MSLNLLEAKTAKYFSVQNKPHYLGLWAAIVFLWVLFFPYAGITHDAQLYTLQALSHVEPELYKNDIFLRFGSQDQFTLFSPVYAAFIKFFGLLQAGALLTLISHCLFFGAVFLLAKQFMPYGLAVFALGLILVVSSYYGAERVFHYIEFFITPRMLSEAFVLFSIVAWLKKKNIMAAALLLIALSLHPLMAAAGLVFLLSSIYVAYWCRLSLLAALSVALLLLISLTTQFLTHWQFDADWLSIIEKHSSYLFFYYWTMDDFANALVPLISLIVSCLFLRGDKEKQLAVAALFTGVIAFLVQGLGSDLLHIALITQGQAWRWFWLATLVAILLLPNLTLRLWQEKSAGKIILITLIAAWLMRSQLIGLVVAIWALVLVCALKKNWGSEFFWTLSTWMGAGLFLLPFVLLAGVSHFHVDVVIALFKGSRLQDFHGIWHESALTLYLLLIGGLIYSSVYKRLHLSIGIALFLSAFLAFWYWGKGWLPERSVQASFLRLAELREVISIGEDVFAFGPPSNTWVGLQRPNYLSSIQMAGIVFSRETAIEANRRAKAISLLCPTKDTVICNQGWGNWQQITSDFAPFCKAAGVRFVMSSIAINAKGLVAIQLSDAQRLPYLYRCAAE